MLEAKIVEIENRQGTTFIRGNLKPNGTTFIRGNFASWGSAPTSTLFRHRTTINDRPLNGTDQGNTRILQRKTI